MSIKSKFFSGIEEIKRNSIVSEIDLTFDKQDGFSEFDFNELSKFNFYILGCKINEFFECFSTLLHHFEFLGNI